MFLRIIYVVSLAIGFAVYIYYNSFIQFPDEKSLYRYLEFFNIIRLFLIVFVLLAVSNFILRFINEKENSSRKKLKWVLLGCVIGPLCFALLRALPILI
ncbi:hypothetical protein [Ignavibacterium sp.]